MINIEDLFKPGSPINRKEMLVGRTRQLNHINKVLTSGGRAVVVTGTRGIGKTSLANIAAQVNGKQLKVDCDTDSTFHTWALDLLNNLGLNSEIIEKTVEEAFGASFKATLLASFGVSGTQKTVKKERGLGDINLTPSMLFKIILKLSPDCIITVDEFDRIPKNKTGTISLFGDFIKLLGNRADEHNIKMIFMGVGSSAQVLFNNHESIKRNVSSVHLTRLSKKSIREYLEHINEVSNYKFSPPAIKLMVTDFRGFPHWVHLVGKYCLLEMPEGGEITPKIYEENANEAIDEIIGVDTKFDLVRRSKTMSADLIIERIVNESNMRPQWKEIVDLLKNKYQIENNDIQKSLSMLKDKGVVRLWGGNICLVDPEIAPFLYANLRKTRHVSKEYKNYKNAGKQLSLIDCL